MNWGNKLLFVFILFGSGISYMVYRCMQTPVDLVSKDYYRDELAYQHVIDGTRQANTLSGKVQLNTTAESIRIQLPAEMKHRTVTGSIRFYCPSDAIRDRDIILHPDDDGRQDIARNQLTAGHYTVSISWEAGGVGYFSQQPFVIQ